MTAGEASPEFHALRARMEAVLNDELPALRALDPWRRTFQVLVLLAVWLAGAALGLAPVSGGWGAAARLAGIGLCAVALNAFVLVLHDGMHASLARRPALNRWGAVACGVPAFMAFTAYRIIHTAHHRHLGTTGDPDHYRNYSQRPWALAVMQGLRLLVGAFLYVLAIPVLAWRRADRTERRHLLQEYAVLVAALALVFWAVPMALLAQLWLWPAVLVAFMVQVRGFSQHALTDASHPLRASRTVLAHPVVEFFLLHENHHVEHHLFPEIPSYNLARLHARLWPHLADVETSPNYRSVVARFLRQPRLAAGPGHP